MLKELVSKYVQTTERVLSDIHITKGSILVDVEKTQGVIEMAQRYLEDAKYYQKRNKLETSLASVAYCEGLLDALRLLGIVEFSW
ncbi:MAG: hypothetical protein AOA65_2397 [Candidatus Bathyarchaeota archaeon BA1]|nr:MAG: hypothetical protein AOA65_2397 [Candidatus Bathyarchaeota archaeon BA1]